MSDNQSLISRMKELSKEGFLIQAPSYIDESFNDPEITQEEHQKLFDTFMERAEELFPNPSRSESTHIKHIVITRHSKE